MTGQTRRNVMQIAGSVLGGIAVGSTVTAAERTDRFIVDTKRKASTRTLEQAGLEIVHDLSDVNLAVVEGVEADLKSVTERYEVDVEVQLDEPETPEELANKDGIFDVPARRNDEDLYELAWDKQAQEIKQAQKESRGEGTRVAVIDDGIYADHPDLHVNESLSRNFTRDDNGTGPLFDDHGTHVAGTIAAEDNRTGVVGTAPGAELVDLRVFSGPFATFGSILAAIVYATAIDADAANLSLGAYPVPRQVIGQFYGKALNRVMTFANSNGTLLVIAAGNDSANLQQDRNFISLPNEGAQGLGVAATGPEGFYTGKEGFEDPPESPAYYTNYGTNAIDLGAPGGDLDLEALARFFTPDGDDPDDAPEDPLNLGEIRKLIGDWVLSTTFDATGTPETNDLDGDGDVDIITNEPTSRTPRYGYKQGTSMAAPQVAGAAALVKGADPSLNANQVESVLKETASVPEGYDKAFYGAGFVDPLAAVQKASGEDEARGDDGTGNGK